MNTSKNIILTHQDIINKIKRIAYQIYESNINESELILAGISSNGFILAKLLNDELTKISNISITLCSVEINKKQPLSDIKTSLNPIDYTNKSIVLIDDVLNSGTTLIYGVKHFLNVSLKQFKTAVLINRNHKKFPVKADFKGISLSTSLNEHVIVSLKDGQYQALLS